MIAALRSEWIRIRRPRYLLVCSALAALASILATALTVSTAGSSTTAQRQGPGDAVTVAQLSQADGGSRGLLAVITLLGVIVLCLSAAAFAADHSSGMLRNLLVRHPRRGSLLAGKFAAVALLGGLMVAVAVVVSVLTSYLAVPSSVSTRDWLGADGLRALASATVNVYAATVGYALFGAVLGTLLRSPTLAVSIGLAWLLPVEQLLSSTLDSTKKWLPGQVLSAVAHGGNSSLAYGGALALAVVYLVLAAGPSVALFVRRDVMA
jgi:ABC-type transport system involved in multi-copper enzyme maturation permease subunit